MKAQIVFYSSMALSLLCLLVMCSWRFDFVSFVHFGEKVATMKFNTALLFFITGVGIFLAERKILAIKYSCILVLITASLTLLEYLLYINFGIDQLVSEDHYSQDSIGRMSPATAVSFMLLACSPLIYGRFSSLRSVLRYLVTLVGMICFFRHLLEIPNNYIPYFFRSMSVYTSFLLLCFGVILDFHEKKSVLYQLLFGKTAASQMFRQMVMLLLVIPLLAAYVIQYLATQGQLNLQFGLTLFLCVFCSLSVAYIVNLLSKFQQNEQKLAVHRKNLIQKNKELKRFKSAVDDVSIISTVNADKEITYVNRNFMDITRYSESELLGENHQIVDIPERDEKQFMEMWADLHAGKSWNGDMKCQAKGGDHFWVHTTVVPYLQSETGMQKFMFIRRDITAQKLEQEASEENKRVLQSENAFLTSFAYTVAHDLKQPLETVLGLIGLLGAKLKEPIEKEATLTQLMIHVNNSGLRMKRLIEDLLSFARSDRRVGFTSIDLMETCRGIVHDLAAQIESSKGEVRFDNLPTIIGEETNIRLLFQNIISNSLKFVPANHQPKVEIKARVEQQFFHFQISDNGIGVPEDKLEEVFGVFSKIHGISQYPGSGLGLANCRKIVKAHDGEIFMTSEEGKGTTVHFRLSRQLKEKAPVAQTQD